MHTDTTSNYCSASYKNALYFCGMNTISTRITQARKAKNLNQSELARSLEVSPQAVQNWESGKSQPKGARIEALANALGISVQYLMTGVAAANEMAPETAKILSDMFEGPSQIEKSRSRLEQTLSVTRKAIDQADQASSRLRESLADMDMFRKIQDPGLMIDLFYILAAAAEHEMGLTIQEREQLSKIARRIKDEPITLFE